MDDMMKKVNVTRKQVIEVGQMVQRATIDMGADGNRQFIIGVYAWNYMLPDHKIYYNN